MKNLYEILEISKDATTNEIKRKYRELTKKYHPDKFSNASEESKKQAENKFREINEAYSILGNENTRKEYDKQLSQSKNFSKEKLKKSAENSKKTFEDIYQNFTTGGLFNNFFKPKSKKDDTGRKIKDSTNNMFESFFFQRRK